LGELGLTDTKESADLPEHQAEPVVRVSTGERIPKIRQIIFVALISALFTLAFLETLGFLNTAFWQNDFVVTNRWMIPVLVLFFSLLVGIVGKYMRAPNVIHGSMEDVLTDPNFHPDYSTFPGALLTSFFSLLSGASVGPEGPLTFLVVDIAAWLGTKLRLAERTMLGFAMAGLASALNGIIGNPLFAALFATELGGDNGGLQQIAWNLVAGVIGYMFFALIGYPAFASSIASTPVNALTLPYSVDAVILGIIGALLAIFIGVSLQGIGRVMDRVFKDRFIERVMAGGVIIAIVGYFVPEVLFSGEAQIHPILANPVAYGVLMLLGLAILKILLLALSFKSGYIGGPIFPTLFASTMVALAISLLFPSVPAGLLITGIIAAAVTLVLGAPFAAILLTVTVATANTYELGYIGLATATALIIGTALRTRRSQRTAKRAGA
jgi:H+/Cl- antiporter ClcA